MKVFKPATKRNCAGSFRYCKKMRLCMKFSNLQENEMFRKFSILQENKTLQEVSILKENETLLTFFDATRK
jgi:hypothetical protein